LIETYIERIPGGQPVERSPYAFKTPKPIRRKLGKINDVSESDDSNARVEIEDDNSQIESEDDDFETPKALKKVAQTLASDDDSVDNVKAEVDYALESDQLSDIPPKKKLGPKGSNALDRIDLAKMQKKNKRAFRDEVEARRVVVKVGNFKVC